MSCLVFELQFRQGNVNVHVLSALPLDNPKQIYGVAAEINVAIQRIRLMSRFTQRNISGISKLESRVLCVSKDKCRLLLACLFGKNIILTKTRRAGRVTLFIARGAQISVSCLCPLDMVTKSFIRPGKGN